MLELFPVSLTYFDIEIVKFIRLNFWPTKT